MPLQNLLKIKYKMKLVLKNIYNVLLGKNKFIGIKNNSIKVNSATLKNVTIDIKGKGNEVVIGDYSFLQNVHITIAGDNNLVEILGKNRLYNTTFHIFGDFSEISLGNSTTVHGDLHYGYTNFCVDGPSKILIGEDCMLSYGIMFMTGDFHTIVDQHGNKANMPRSILIGDHVWIGYKATLLKGTEVASKCIVGACSLLTKSHREGNCIISGHPATVVKNGINWLRERTI